MNTKRKIAIRVENLTKTFQVRTRSEGFWGNLSGLFRPSFKNVHAIENLSFEVAHGEKVAFIGPNGAGKSTTIKMLTGILHPTSGEIEVLGMTPWKKRTKLGYKIGTVFGQRTQLWYHLPPHDTFDLLAKIYELTPREYRSRLDELTSTFELTPFMDKPVRQLSLGERMRCELVASLLHKPDILFLDEPTIGLDINAKLMIRSLLNKLSLEQGTTLFLTSHDTADIEQVCERVMILDQGALVLDSSIWELKKKLIKKKKLTLLTNGNPISIHMPGVNLIEKNLYKFVCEVDLAEISIEKVIEEAVKFTNLQDVTIEDPSMEEIIRGIYAQSSS